MKSNWKMTTIGDLISVKRGYDLTSKDRNTGNIPVYGAAGQNGYHNESKVNGPGIVIGRSGGSFGQVHYVAQQSFWPHNTAMYVTDFNGNDVDFVFYLLKTLDFSALNSGSAQPSLNRNYLYPVKVRAPHLDEQILIGQLLSSLDRKIELNNKINSELEAMAKLIYDYWFVQFDFPDASGKPYKSSGGKMVYNEELKREIPEGWTLKAITEEMDVQYGYPFSTKLFNAHGEGAVVVRIRNILDNSISIFSTEKVDDKYLLKTGDLLVGMDGNFHLNFWDKEGCYLNQRCVRIRSVDNSCVSQLQALFQIEPYIKAREKNVSRTTVGHLSAKDINSLKVLIPRSEQMKNKRAFFDSILSKIVVNREENSKLTKLRDWLLPMLMNGQVTVSTK
ncbi:restriction endonuclease subunit S [Brumicola blandensis]|uniref:Restriction endonuclease subunit S n=1 Tax=Brumicola blandensis TaxID=3075611 RepID=A0AAW8R327_9ALTE|nr:restriction endonuclease subunit S [Alteromonas sp. W409]MDT0583310.1 restriction endonuclease subunit S [Alteromonas sp. W409]